MKKRFFWPLFLFLISIIFLQGIFIGSFFSRKNILYFDTTNHAEILEMAKKFHGIDEIYYRHRDFYGLRENKYFPVINGHFLTWAEKKFHQEPEKWSKIKPSWSIEVNGIDAEPNVYVASGKK